MYFIIFITINNKMEEYEILVETENVFDDIKFESNNDVNEPTSPIKVNEDFFTEILLQDIQPSSTNVFVDFSDVYTKVRGAVSVSMLLGSCVLLIQATPYLNWIGAGLALSCTGMNMIIN
jgi:hypothetical protein